MVPPSTFVFASPQDLVNFVAPEATNETEKQEQNFAQRNLQARLQHCLGCNSQSKKKPLGPDVDTKLREILDMKLTNGYEGWWKNLKQKEKLSGLDKDIILLVEAFGNKELAWRFSRYPEIDRLFKQPYDYGKLLVLVMRWNPAAERHIKQGHTSVNETKEDPLGGATQPLDPQPACKRPANERDDVDAHTQVASESVQRNDKRPNKGENHQRKRTRYGSEQPDTHGANDTMLAEHAISTSISVPDQEPCMPTSPEQSAGVETPAPIERRSTVHSLMLVSQAPTIEDVSPNFKHLGQTGSAEPMQSDGSALDRHTSIYECNTYQTREDSSMQTPGILDDSNPRSDPARTLDEPDHELSDLVFTRVEVLDDTDSIIRFRWAGSQAIRCIEKDTHSVNDGKWCYINMALGDLPFKRLAETIQQSKMWKREKLDISAKTSCLTLQLRRKVIDRYCNLDCIVPTAMVPQVLGIWRPDDHAK
jgi:hypothetical protein